MTQKTFDIDEANAALPLMQEELNRLQDTRREFLRLFQEWKTLKPYYRKEIKAPINEKVFLLECNLEFLNYLSKLHIRNLESTGVQIRDIEKGHVDFPGVHFERFVHFCWRQGEPEIKYYHPAGGDDFHRYPIDFQGGA